MADRHRFPFENDANDAVEEPVVETAAPVDAAPEVQPTGGEPVAVEARYTTGSWGGIEQFVCATPGCPYDTLDAKSFELHWQAVHYVPPPAPTEPRIEINPDNGTPIVPTQEV